MKEKLVFDSTPLIYFAKAKIIDKIAALSSEKIILESVYKEVVIIGKEKGKEDAFHLDNAVRNKVFTIQKFFGSVISSAKVNKALSETDREVLSFCKLHRTCLITDDEQVRIIAEIEGIEHHGSMYILFSLLKQKIMTSKECRDTLKMIVENGWYCSLDLYQEIIEKLSENK